MYGFNNVRLPSQYQTSSGEINFTVLLLHTLGTIVLVAVVLLVRAVLVRNIRKNEALSAEGRRIWLVSIRNVTILVTLIGLVLIWAQELRTLAVYVFAIAVATVIATKELIQCLTGGIMRATSRSFKLGDRIEIGDYRGDVIDYNLFTTTILETGPGKLTHRLTGRSVTLPNSMFLTKPLTNESKTHPYVLHVFKVAMKLEDDWQQAEADLLESAREQCASYIEDARRHFNRLSQYEGLIVLSVDPHVTVSLPSVGTVELLVRLATPVRQKGRVEQAILRHFLYQLKERAKQQTKAAAASESAEKEQNSAPPEKENKAEEIPATDGTANVPVG